MGCDRNDVVPRIWPERTESLQRGLKKRVVANVSVIVHGLVQEDSHGGFSHNAGDFRAHQSCFRHLRGHQPASNLFHGAAPRTRRGAPRASVRPSSADNHRQGLDKQDLEVEPHAVVAYVIHVESDALFIADVRPPVHLPEPGYARLDG